MPELSNPSAGSPSSDTAPAPRKMLRLNKAGRIIKSLASLFVFAFLCAYAHTYLRYGAPRTQTTASVARAITISPTRSPLPIPYRVSHRRQAFFRPVHQVNRHARRSKPYYLASLRHIRRLFSQLLVVRS
jgi:hypothetical protein